MVYEYKGNTLQKSDTKSRRRKPAADPLAVVRPYDEPVRESRAARSKAPSKAPSEAPGKAPSEGPGEARDGRTLAQVLAAVFGLVFLLVGIAGFIPGLTQNVGDLKFIGEDSGAELLGLFQVSVLHNIVHLVFGVGLLAAARPATARLYLLGGGVVYLLVAVYGIAVIDGGSAANFLPVNDADNVLHIGLSLGLLVAGAVAVAVERRSAARA